MIEKQIESQQNQTQFKEGNSLNKRAKSSTIDSLDKSPDPGGFGTITEIVSFQQLLKTAQDKSESRTIKLGDHNKLRGITYSKFEQPKSQVVQIARDKQQSQIDQQRSSQKLLRGSSEYRGFKQQPASGDLPGRHDKLGSSSGKRLKSGSKMQSLERNQMLESLGGFYSSKIQDLYYQQMARPASRDK